MKTCSTTAALAKCCMIGLGAMFVMCMALYPVLTQASIFSEVYESANSNAKFQVHIIKDDYTEATSECYLRISFLKDPRETDIEYLYHMHIYPEIKTGKLILSLTPDSHIASIASDMMSPEPTLNLMAKVDDLKPILLKGDSRFKKSMPGNYLSDDRENIEKLLDEMTRGYWLKTSIQMSGQESTSLIGSAKAIQAFRETCGQYYGLRAEKRE